VTPTLVQDDNNDIKTHNVHCNMWYMSCECRGNTINFKDKTKTQLGKN
jgi:hypothetical protein